jgi:DNA ligase-associated metallophosphoesterase
MGGGAALAPPRLPDGALPIALADTTAWLLPQRALYLPAQRMLLVADLHLGKGLSFRRRGVPVPAGTTAQTLQRLADAVAVCDAAQVVFLGDLLHCADAQAQAVREAFTTWRARHADLALTLVRGNHDRHAGDPPPDWGVQVVDEPWPAGPPGRLLLAHHPQPQAQGYVLAGHVHPAVVLGGRAHQRLRLPCFHFGPALGLLPAFGAFTGAHVVARGAGDRVAVVTPEGVHLLPGKAA